MKYKRIDINFLQSNNNPCVICAKPTSKTIRRKYNRVDAIKDTIIDVDKLDWEAISRLTNLLLAPPIVTIKGSSKYSHDEPIHPYNLYIGTQQNTDWSGPNAPVVTIVYSGEDFTEKIPREVYRFMRKAFYLNAKNKERVLRKRLVKENEKNLTSLLDIREYDTNVSCCSRACLTLYTIQNL